MQIQLKQNEIVTALKQYISGQGISLDGKDVKISFTAGRKESGITADLVIEDVAIPGYTNEPAEEVAKAAVLALVPSQAPAPPDVGQDPVPEPAVVEEVVKPSTSSLFS